MSTSKDQCQTGTQFPAITKLYEHQSLTPRHKELADALAVPEGWAMLGLTSILISEEIDNIIEVS